MYAYFFVIFLAMGFASWLGYDTSPPKSAQPSSQQVAEPSSGGGEKGPLCCDIGAPGPPRFF